MSITKSPSLDPRNISVVGEAFQNDPAVQTAASALTVASQTADAIGTAVRAAAADPTLTEDARRVKIGDYTDAKWQQVTRALDSSRAEIRKALESEEREIAKSSQVPAGQEQFATEVRNRLAAMPPEKRQRVIADAIKNGDRLTAGAVLHAPAWLADISESRRDAYRLQWAQTHHADKLARMRALEQAVDVTERAGAAFLGMIGDIQAAAKDAREAAKRTREALSA